MPNVKLQNYLHLHLIVFVWGFTAVLGALISIDAIPLVWYRMGLAVLFVLGYIAIQRFDLRVPRRVFWIMVVAGGVIALHWVTFFMAIKVSNVSITLATLSTGAFFTAILEPIWYKRKFIWYELLFGVLVIAGLAVIFRVETRYVEGILLALLSALLSAVFSLINGKLAQQYRPSVVSFYELGSGVLFITIYLAATGAFTSSFFELSNDDWMYLGILASVCTAYAFIASVKVMKYITPYTVMLTINLEPVYGILLAYLVLGDSEQMSTAFYFGALIILLTVVANGILKNSLKRKAAIKNGRIT